MTSILALALALETLTTPAPKLRLDSSTLSSDIKAVGQWCGGRPRVQLTLTNRSAKTVWVALERGAGREIPWDRYSYFDERGGAAAGGIADGDVLSFLKSGRATRLDPGKSGKWLLRLGSEALHRGRAELTVRGPIEGTTTLDEPHVTLYEFDAELSVVLGRSGRCYTPRGG